MPARRAAVLRKGMGAGDYSMIALALCVGCASASAPAAKWRKVTLGPSERSILDGPPGTVGMMSGLVVLKPGEAMHRHSTESNEEEIVFLAGRATLGIGAETVGATAGEIVYIPPRTPHEIRNASGSDELRYVWVAAPVR